MQRSKLFWSVVVGLVGVTVVIIFAISRDAEWGWPAILTLVILGVSPAAKAIGSRKAFATGARMRERSDSAKRTKGTERE
jgi:hypothetical protein